MKQPIIWLKFGFSLATVLIMAVVIGKPALAVTNPQGGSVGLQGTISSPPPTQAATISIPRDGQAFGTIPIDVSGICPKGLLVKLFKNNVFAGSQQCDSGSFSIKIDLFTGANELVARVYDSLDQNGPDSNKVNVSFNDAKQGAASRPTLTSTYAKKGVNPGDTLSWPIVLAGGEGPYAISVDWGDSKAPDLKSLQFAGTFNIDHKYDTPGVYNIVIKATDKNGVSAFLQLVGIANGALSQDNAAAQNKNGGGGTTTQVKSKIIWQPAAISIPFVISTFWLGKRHELRVLKKKIERGDRPF